MRLQLRVVVFALACVLAAYGQNTGRLSGTVLDASGASIPAATVNLMLAGGNAPIQTVKSGQDGGFFFASLQPVNYDLSVEMSGFRKELIRGLKVDPGVELAMKPLNLEVSQQVETIEVTAENVGVQTANAEVASTITNSQVRRLPVLNRSPLGLISTQAGIGSNSRTPTTINGLRPSFTNITVDGINVQDNFIRSNALDYLPNLLLLDQVAEFTVSTSNTNAALGSGAAQVTFNTPSGSNELHGNAYWYNRNNIASANTWFNNKNGVDRPFLNQNQLGGSIGGPILKDKLFFYANYEALRLRQQSPQTRTILTSDARNGIFTYRDVVNGAIQKASVLQLSNSAFDSVTRGLIGQIPGFEQANRTDIGDGLNTAGYAFNQRDNRTRDNVTGKVDYVLSMRHSVSGTYMWNRDMDDRPDVAAEGYTVAPLPRGDNTTNLISAAWRYVPTGSFTNELRGGVNLAPGLFLTSQDFGSSVLGMPTVSNVAFVSNPVNTFRPQGRYTDTYNLADNATMIKGRHTIAFGAQYQRIHIENFANFDVVPTFALGMSQSNTKTLVSAQLPGVRSQDLANANSLLALTGGFLNTGLQSFNVTSQTSGFVPGASNTRNLRMQNLAFYINDTWRVNRRFTLTAGLRWEYWSPVSERDGIALLPVLQNGNVIQTLLDPVGTVDFPTGPWYGKDMNNFGPNVGFSWQPFSDNGKTVIRGGYSINYPNDDFMVSMSNNVLGGANAGLNQNRSITNLVAPAASDIPTIAPPAYKVPRTYAENAALDPAGVAFAMPDPNLRTPYVQQWSFGVQREMAGGVVEGRYVGNHAVKQWRAFDYNQILIKGTPFLADFKRAQTNGLLAQGAGRGFDPRYNPAIPGSQPTPVFDSMPSGGLLTNGTIVGLIQTGEVAGLAHTYVTNRLNGAVQFYTNTNSYGTNVMSNYSGANYHALQLDYRKTFRSGWQFQANYTLAKSLSDSTGDSQTRFEAFLDNDNAAIEYAPTTFDLRHAFKVNGVWELPIGKGQLVDVENSVLNMIVGGWTVGGLMTWQSGSPFSILSARNTLNRTGRSASNTATAIGSLDDVIGFYMTGNGPYMVSQSAIDPATGRGVAGDGRPTFAGQVFANPDAGSLGALQRRMFYGPTFWNTDLSIIKHFQITEAQRLEFRSEFFNLTNSPSFYIGDQNINSTTFGRITTAASGRRVIQFGLYYRF